MVNVDIGILSYGLYLPESFETDEQIAENAGLTIDEVHNLGLRKKHKPGQDDQPVAMAVKAAMAALDKVQDIGPEDVDVVIWTGEEYKDYIAQTAAIRLQEEIGCRNAWAFDLVGQGVTSIIGLRVARDLIRADDSVNTILIAGGTRNVDLVDYGNPETRFLIPSSASGGALLVKRNNGIAHLSGLAVEVHPEMADAVYVPGGGTELPFSKEILESSAMFYQAAQPDLLKSFMGESWTNSLARVAGKALENRRPDYVALRHMSPMHREQTLKEIGIDEEKSVPLFDYGHHGPNDVIISLDQGLQKGLINKGSTVVLVSGGIGFSFAAAVLEWH